MSEIFKWTHLGDGVYAKSDQGGVWLHANSHDQPTDIIYLEWMVLRALWQKLEPVLEHLKEKK